MSGYAASMLSAKYLLQTHWSRMQVQQFIKRTQGKWIQNIMQNSRSEMGKESRDLQTLQGQSPDNKWSR